MDPDTLLDRVATARPESVPDAAGVVRDVAQLLRRRQRLREIRAEMTARRTTTLPPGCVEADREQRARSDELTAETSQDLRGQLAAREAEGAAVS